MSNTTSLNKKYDYLQENQNTKVGITFKNVLFFILLKTQQVVESLLFPTFLRRVPTIKLSRISSIWLHPADQDV